MKNNQTETKIVRDLEVEAAMKALSRKSSKLIREINLKQAHGKDTERLEILLEHYKTIWCSLREVLYPALVK